MLHACTQEVRPPFLPHLEGQLDMSHFEAVDEDTSDDESPSSSPLLGRRAASPVRSPVKAESPSQRKASFAEATTVIDINGSRPVCEQVVKQTGLANTELVLGGQKAPTRPPAASVAPLRSTADQAATAPTNDARTSAQQPTDSHGNSRGSFMRRKSSKASVRRISTSFVRPR